MPFHSIKPKLQVPNFYLILPLLNLNASNSSTTTLKKKKNPQCLHHYHLLLLLCCSSYPRSTSAAIHIHTRVESAKVWWIWKFSLLSQVHICVFFFFFSALLPCLCPLRFLGTSMSRDHSLYCVWLFVTFFVLYFYYFIYKGITLFELVSTA